MSGVMYFLKTGSLARPFQIGQVRVLVGFFMFATLMTAAGQPESAVASTLHFLGFVGVLLSFYRVSDSLTESAEQGASQDFDAKTARKAFVVEVGLFFFSMACFICSVLLVVSLAWAS